MLKIKLLEIWSLLERRLVQEVKEGTEVSEKHIITF